MADNGVESGLYEVWQLIETGRLRFFTTLQNTAAEYRIYRRDDKGRVVKENDHLMDCLRYAVVMFNQIARQRPVQKTGGERAAIVDTKAGY